MSAAEFLAKREFGGLETARPPSRHSSGPHRSAGRLGGVAVESLLEFLPVLVPNREGSERKADPSSSCAASGSCRRRAADWSRDVQTSRRAILAADSPSAPAAVAEAPNASVSSMLIPAAAPAPMPLLEKADSC